MPKGVIYIMTNKALNGYVKIGYATDVRKRLAQLYQSSASPYPFELYATYDTDEKLSDIEVHHLIDSLNPHLRSSSEVNGKKRVREFYTMSAEEAYGILRSIAKVSGTENRLHLYKPITDDKDRKERFRFSMVGLKSGDKVVFIKDNTIIATVADDTHVEYNGEIISLSGLAEKLLNSKALAGPHYFTFNGVPLNEIRKSKEVK